MANDYKYKFEPYSGRKSRHICPQCNDKRSTFSRYIDSETGGYLADYVGICERKEKCGYHYTPSQFFEANGVKPLYKPIINRKLEYKPISLIDSGLLIKSLDQSNNLIVFLDFLFGPDIAGKIACKYQLGTSNHWPGAVVFWQVDFWSRIRTGKIMAYSPLTGKRVKEPFNHISWVHKVLNIKDFNLQQCFFGEHLLKDSANKVAIVESEKTALIASVYLPEFTWLAVGSLNNLSKSRCSILRGKDVTLFPDLEAFEKWSLQAEKLLDIGVFKVSSILENNASIEDREGGLDLADYLIRTPYPEFRRKRIEAILNNSGQGLSLGKSLEIIQNYYLTPEEFYQIAYTWAENNEIQIEEYEA